MKKAHSRREIPEMLAEYDFSGGVRGKYAPRFAKGTIMVVLDPDVAEVFPDPKSVNEALRALGQIIRDRPTKLVPPPSRRKIVQLGQKTKMSA